MRAEYNVGVLLLALFVALEKMGIVFERKKYVSLVQVVSSIMHWLSAWFIHKKLALKNFFIVLALQQLTELVMYIFLRHMDGELVHGLLATRIHGSTSSLLFGYVSC